VRLGGGIREKGSFYIVAEILAVEAHASIGGLQESREHLHGSGFAGAVRSEIAEDFAGDGW